MKLLASILFAIAHFGDWLDRHATRQAILIEHRIRVRRHVRWRP